MRKKIVIQTPTNTANGSGGYDVVWSTYATLYADKFEPISATESLRLNRSTHLVTHKVRTRFKSGITNKMRVLWDSRYFNIHSIINVKEMNQFLDLQIEENIPT